MAKVKVEKETNERWLVTYADLMNLLLILFIVLYSISQIDVEQYQHLSQSLREAFGMGTGIIIGDGGSRPNLVENSNDPGGYPSLSHDAQTDDGFLILPTPSQSTDGADSSPTPTPNPNDPEIMEQREMERIRDAINQAIEAEDLADSVHVALLQRGIVISIQDKVLFSPGSATVSSEFNPLMNQIAEIIKRIPTNYIRIEGHTDSDPMVSSSRFADNWDLSSARANSVLRLLAARGVDYGRLSSVGYAETRPVAENDSAVNKAKNRRVDITILREVYSGSESGEEMLPLYADYFTFGD
ncbi:MAG: flagellar motor protein MotB [Oscillospiraceae bacterium]|nr:flagellar motor protein MotB [Oscillospiraceae bacterium]